MQREIERTAGDEYEEDTSPEIVDDVLESEVVRRRGALICGLWRGAVRFEKYHERDFKCTVVACAE